MLVQSHLLEPSEKTREALFNGGYQALRNYNDEIARAFFQEFLKAVTSIDTATIEALDDELVARLAGMIENDPADPYAAQLAYIIGHLEPERILVVSGDAAHLWSSPDDDQKMIAELARGDRLTILSKAGPSQDADGGQWYQVWVDGKVGFVLAP
jgi:hypothetical protein